MKDPACTNSECAKSSFIRLEHLKRKDVSVL